MPTLADLHTLANDCQFQFLPNTATQNPYGLVGIGADLSAQTLVHAYLQGIFPWFNEGEPIAWYSPTPRCVLIPNTFKPKRSLITTAKKGNYQITLNQAFAQVMMACSLPRTYTNESWISQAMQTAYQNLHQLGIAHSIEVWQNDILVGGLYGLKLGAVFCGESMFHKQTDCSKLAFWAMTVLCQQTGVQLIDCQLVNDHLLSLGAMPMDSVLFLEKLASLVSLDNPAAVHTTDWQTLSWTMDGQILINFK